MTSRCASSLFDADGSGPNRPLPSGASERWSVLGSAVTPASSPRCRRGPPKRVRAILHVLHHPGPEAPGSHRGRHEVGCVEPARSVLEGSGQNLGCIGQDGRSRSSPVPPRRWAKCVKRPGCPLGALQVLGRRTARGSPLPRPRFLNTTASSPANSGAFLVDRREGEPVVVHAGLACLRGRTH